MRHVIFISINGHWELQLIKLIKHPPVHLNHGGL